MRMKGGSSPAKQIHQCRDNPWIHPGVTLLGFKKGLMEDARGRALNRRAVVWCEVESAPSWGQVREGEWRCKDSLGIVNLSGESFNTCCCTWQLHRVFGYL